MDFIEIKTKVRDVASDLLEVVNVAEGNYTKYPAPANLKREIHSAIDTLKEIEKLI